MANLSYENIGISAMAGAVPSNTINNLEYTEFFDKEVVKEIVAKTTDKSIYAEMDIIVVDIQLDIDYLDDEPQLELSQFNIAIKEIGSLSRPGTLIIIETTVPPGTCEFLLKPLLNKIKKESFSVYS
mgnify:CR=1 FL=1